SVSTSVEPSTAFVTVPGRPVTRPTVAEAWTALGRSISIVPPIGTAGGRPKLTDAVAPVEVITVGCSAIAGGGRTTGATLAAPGPGRDGRRSGRPWRRRAAPA